MSGAFTDYRENFAVGSSDGLKADQHLCSGKPKLKAKNLLPACSTRCIPKACGKKHYGKMMERDLCNRDWEGYSVIWEAGTEGTAWGAGGAGADVCGASMSGG